MKKFRFDFIIIAFVFQECSQKIQEKQPVNNILIHDDELYYKYMEPIISINRKKGEERMKRAKIGVVGVGCISDVCLRNIQNMFDNIEVIGVCDLIPERAQNAVKKYNIPKIYKDMYELFADDEVDIVLNITRPYEHYDVKTAALLEGKHVYSEKPLSPRFEEAKELVELAVSKGVMLGGAPDTFMGAGIQTARKLIDEGFIGQPIGANARLATHGPEDWHPDPEFVYKYGGGPMLDMGPYYITALINLLGRATRVCGMTKASFSQRPILSEEKYGMIMDVEVPTYEAGVIQFESGAIGQIFMTFDIYTDDNIGLQIYGTEGSLIVPDPNCFGGEVKLLRANCDKFEVIPLLFNYKDNSRGLGLADMAEAIQNGRLHRANSMQQLHLVEIMNGFTKSSESGKFVEITSPYIRQKPMVYRQVTGCTY